MLELTDTTILRLRYREYLVSEIAEMFEKVLLGLGPSYCQVLRLYLRRCTILEIARRGGCSPATVRDKLDRFCWRVRALLDEDMDR